MDVVLDILLLEPHPAAPPTAISGVSCNLSWRNAGEWVLTFAVEEPPEALRLPRVVEAARADGLWKTTCFELFLRRPGEAGYLEFNFSPSGEWSAWAFDGYREGRRDLQIATPIISTTDPERFRMASKDRMLALGLDEEAARLLTKSDELPPGPGLQFVQIVSLTDPVLADGGPWLASVSAVVEEAHGKKSYWALAHPSDKPDFHHPDSFVLELP